MVKPSPKLLCVFLDDFAEKHGHAARMTARKPCIIKGEKHYGVAAAARLIEVVPQSTLHHWAVRGWTSFGLSLDIVVRNRRRLIPELNALVVKEFLHDHPLPKPGTSPGEREEFKRAAKFFSWLQPRSPYSRARRPPGAKAPHP
jgi:hypothetical protein